MKRIIFSLVIVLMLVMMALLAANLPPIEAGTEALLLECDISPTTTTVGHEIDCRAQACGGVQPYSWSWTVDGEEVSNDRNTSIPFDTAGNYTVCITVTDSSENTAGPCCEPITVVGPSLTITKKDSPDPVSAGGTLVYTITVNNTGSDNATGVTVVDDYDETVLNIIDPDGGLVAGGTITWNGGITIPPGGSLSYIITATVSPTALDGSSFNNTADVTCAEGISDFITIDTMVIAEKLHLECEPAEPITINVCDGNVIDFVAVVGGGVPPYDWDWTVNGILEKWVYNTYSTITSFTRTFDEPGFYTVCVNVTDSLGEREDHAVRMSRSIRL